ncbi:HNH endonuclease signature motif containing protein [Methylobacterium gnaphalii]|uniref:HNH endonuclease signature motif containing protein n=1 Tax=Methylobacterium gnaphalii TaxID=1010610 RepID=UPI0011BFDEEA|nr:HNH endonuclease [Methylobacterium gnaphalii]
MGRLGTLAPRLKVLDTRTARPAPKVADPELLTAEHKAWRLEVLKRAHWRCQWPGCQAHGRRGGVRLYADHILERKDGGASLDPRNGQTLCPKHHQVKTAKARAARMRST